MRRHLPVWATIILLLWNNPHGLSVQAQQPAPIEPLPHLAPDEPSRLPNVLPASAAHVNLLEQRVAELEARLDSYANGKPGDTTSLPMSNRHEVGSDPNMSGKWNSMYEAKSKNGDFRAHVGGCVQFDITAFDNDPALLIAPALGGIGAQPDTLNLRRGRIRLDGTVWEFIDYMAEYEFANYLTATTASLGQPVAINPAITDFWITWTHIPVIGNIRVGNQKEPMGMEHMMSFRFTDFLERSYLQDVVFGPFTNGFSPGISTYNWTEDERATWAIGWFGNSSDVFGYSLGNDYALTGRATWLPYYDELTQGRYLWHVGASASTRGPDEGLVRLRTRGDIRSGPPGTVNPIYADTRDMQADSQQLVNLESAVQWGSWSVQAEYTGCWVPGAVEPFAPGPGTPRGTPFFQGGYVEVMYFLTGEHRNFNKRLGALDRPIVYTPMFILGGRNGCCTGSGAVQVGARYSAMDLNDNGINGGYLQSMTAGLNWFLNPNTKVQFNYDLTHRSAVRDAPAGFINGFGTRFSIDF